MDDRSYTIRERGHKMLQLLLTVVLLVVAVSVPAYSEEPPQYLMQWGSEGSGPGQFNGPQDVAVDNTGNVYVADTQNHRIQKFTGNGTFVTSWGEFGTSDGQMKYPSGVCADNFGHVYVADPLNHRIQRFTDSGVHLLSWGSQGSEHGQLNGPGAVAADESGNVYVTDGGNVRVEKFTSDGQYLLTFAPGYGNGLVAFDGIAVGPYGNVLVTDPSHKTVQEFTTNGQYINMYGCTGGYPNSCAFSHPNDVDLDSEGNFYAVDNDWFRVVKRSPSGTVLTLWGTYGTGDGQFDQPYGIAVNRTTGWVYVAEEYNNRVQVFGDQPTAVQRTSWGTIKSLFR